MSLQCHHRGCGQKYTEDTNNEDSCRHHPGEPFFHDAYKGWSCCHKKCTNFTEFLNIKGCTLSKHSNEKPPEPVKTTIDTSDVIVDVKPSITQRLPRPSFNTELVSLKPTIGPSLLREDITENDDKSTCRTCKNAGCGAILDGNDSNPTAQCIYHPGTPIFHEGLKYWSCCRKRTTDFAAFLSQPGCEQGTHAWLKKNTAKEQIHCKWDYYQTGTHVVVSIYAKQYSPNETTVKLNPVRLNAHVVFPREDCAAFRLDIELNGLIVVDLSSVQMFGSKIEINLRKAEAGNWQRIDVPLTGDLSEESPVSDMVDNITPKVENVDLGDL